MNKQKTFHVLYRFLMIALMMILYLNSVTSVETYHYLLFLIIGWSVFDIAKIMWVSGKRR